MMKKYLHSPPLTRLRLVLAFLLTLCITSAHAQKEYEITNYPPLTVGVGMSSGNTGMCFNLSAYDDILFTGVKMLMPNGGGWEVWYHTDS